MDQWLKIRQQVLADGVSRRQIIRQTGMHWQTLQKILTHSSPPGYQRTKPVKKPKIGPFLERIKQILEADREVPRKQRHTAKRIFERLTDEGYDGGYTVVKDAVRQIKSRSREVFMPLIHRPGEAQVDFGWAVVKMAGVLIKVAFFVMALPHSDAFFVMACPRECTETFWEGHIRAFKFFGFVPRWISYDNNKIAMSKILGPRLRKLTYGFKQLISHYLFKYHFCLVRRPNEKGVAEGVVKFSRLNFFVPVPEVQDFDELNAYLLTRCREDLGRRLRGKTMTKAQLLLEDQAASLELPAVPFEACKRASTISNSESLARFDTNDYSVPIEYAHHPVVVRGYVDLVKISCGLKTIAEHRRCWEKEKQIFDPRHYLRLVQRKPGSLDHARPLETLNLPECFEVLRRRLEAEKDLGVREYIRVLLLLEKHSLMELTVAVKKGLRMRAHSRDAIAQFLFPAEPWEQTTFRLQGREHLRAVKVAQTDITAYGQLLAGAGVK